MHRYGKEKAEAAWMLLYSCEMERVALLHDEVDGQRPAPEWRRAVTIVEVEEGKLADDYDVVDVAVIRPWSFCYRHGLACLAWGLARSCCYWVAVGAAAAESSSWLWCLR